MSEKRADFPLPADFPRPVDMSDRGLELYDALRQPTSLSTGCDDKSSNVEVLSGCGGIPLTAEFIPLTPREKNRW